jgi:Cellulase (glycosyl hydrolase family 5)
MGHLRRQFAAVLAAVLLVLVPTIGGAGARPPASGLRVSANRLVDGLGRGHTVALRGINRSGLEYMCVGGYGFFDSPHPHQIDDPAMIAAMTSWDINIVRVPLNEDCWLGINVPRRDSGAAYRDVVAAYVRALHAAHLYVILELHWAAPGRTVANHQLPMADRDHTPTFWRSVAATFKDDHALIFDLYNEPYAVDWHCWLSGCEIPAGDGGDRAGAYRAAGMQSLVNAVRSAGATQPLMLGGLGYSSVLSGWLAHAPRDPLHQLIADQHNYGGLTPCAVDCQAAALAVHRRVPTMFGELGETDCRSDYIAPIMRFADAHGIGYLGWAWDSTASGWSCRKGPALIQRYDGTPTGFGLGFRDHLRSLGVPPRP